MPIVESTGGRPDDIFINYRRVDSEMPAGRLADLLKRSFDGRMVFMDIDGIEGGVDFVKLIAERLSNCRVFLAVIGPRWLDARKGFSRRIFRPSDFVRLELVAALSRDILVIPVLVEGATMPPAESLPKSIAAPSKANVTSAARTDRWY